MLQSGLSSIGFTFQGAAVRHDEATTLATDEPLDGKGTQGAPNDIAYRSDGGSDLVLRPVARRGGAFGVRQEKACQAGSHGVQGEVSGHTAQPTHLRREGLGYCT